MDFKQSNHTYQQGLIKENKPPGFVKILGLLITFVMVRLAFELVTSDFILSLYPSWETDLLSVEYRVPLLVIIFLLIGFFVALIFFASRKLSMYLYRLWVQSK